MTFVADVDLAVVGGDQQRGTGRERPRAGRPTRRSAPTQLGVVVLAEPVLVGDLVDAVVVGVDERLAGGEQPRAPRRSSVDGTR